MLRVAFVLRSTEVHPVFAKFVFRLAIASGAHDEERDVHVV